MSELELHINNSLEWIRTLSGYSDDWSDIKIVEDPLFEVRDETWNVQNNAFMTTDQYESRFSELLNMGYSWININFGGIYQNSMIIFIEYPRESSNIPKDKVSVNPSGPMDDTWNLNEKLVVVGK